MGQDDSQVSGQSETAGLIRAGSVPEVRGRGFDPGSAAPFAKKPAERVILTIKSGEMALNEDPDYEARGGS